MSGIRFHKALVKPQRNIRGSGCIWIPLAYLAVYIGTASIFNVYFESEVAGYFTNVLFVLCFPFLGCVIHQLLFPLLSWTRPKKVIGKLSVNQMGFKYTVNEDQPTVIPFDEIMSGRLHYGYIKGHIPMDSLSVSKGLSQMHIETKESKKYAFRFRIDNEMENIQLQLILHEFYSRKLPFKEFWQFSRRRIYLLELGNSYAIMKNFRDQYGYRP